MNNNPDQALSQILEKSTFTEVAFGNNSQMDSIWADGKNRGRLIALANDETESEKVRFLSMEMVWIRTSERPEEISPQAAATLLGYALKHSPWDDSNPGLSANQWGFLWYLDAQGYEGAEILSLQMIGLAEAAKPSLMEILDDDRIVEYEGSKDATVGNSLGFRVKDIAAYCLGRILQKPIKWEPSLILRDKLIDSARKNQWD